LEEVDLLLYQVQKRDDLAPTVVKEVADLKADRLVGNHPGFQVPSMQVDALAVV
jgi:hypothetical protein